MGQPRHDLDRNLERLSHELAGQPEASVLEALRNDADLAVWGWTDVKLSTWAQQIAASESAVYEPPSEDLD